MDQMPTYRRASAKLIRLPLLLCFCLLIAACQAPADRVTHASLRAAIDAYARTHADDIASRPAYSVTQSAVKPRAAAPEHGIRLAYSSAAVKPTSACFHQSSPETQPTDDLATPLTFEPPAGYWRRNVWHQMGREGLNLGTHGLWRGFKTAFWDVENALALTVAMGASVSIRETGVDDTIVGRVHGNRQLGDFDEPIQLLGHPGTHFAAAGALWLGSTLTKDVKQHELAKTLGQALAVNGLTTMALKVTVRTDAPNGDRLAWPSGHTSSSFTVAAVLNEHYGPMVGVPSLALAGLVGYQRLDSNVHNFSDVVFGAMLGYVVGSSIARDNQAEFPELFGMELIPFIDPETGTSGLALTKRW